jgi:hypothetical protein
MPISLQPGRTFRITLDSDKDTPDPKPAFIFRVVSMAEFEDLGDLHDQLENLKRNKPDATMRDAMDLMAKTISFAMVGWENMGSFGDYAPGKLKQVLSLGEGQELSGKLLKAQRLTDTDRGNFHSPSPSVSASSAEAVAAASVTTSPAH